MSLHIEKPGAGRRVSHGVDFQIRSSIAALDLPEAVTVVHVAHCAGGDQAGPGRRADIMIDRVSGRLGKTLPLTESVSSRLSAALSPVQAQVKAIAVPFRLVVRHGRCRLVAGDLLETVAETLIAYGAGCD